MNKATQLHTPLARWFLERTRIRLVLPAAYANELTELLYDITSTANAPLNTANQVLRRSWQTLAAEQLGRSSIANRRPDSELALTLTPSVALALLAWLMASPRTDDAASPLRHLLAALHQLLS